MGNKNSLYDRYMALGRQYKNDKDKRNKRNVTLQITGYIRPERKTLNRKDRVTKKY